MKKIDNYQLFKKWKAAGGRIAIFFQYYPAQMKKPKQYK
jgi:hypothetical protein